MDHNIEKAKNMKPQLRAFEQLSNHKIIFHKSELICYEEARNCESQYTELFGCDMGQYAYRYLGIPMHHKKINNDDWKLIEENFKQKSKYLKREIIVILSWASVLQ
jgi:hypothetical protein